MRNALICAAVAAAIGCAGPAEDGNLLRVRAISAGSGFTCALRSDSTAVCWGANQYGQLGSDSSSDTCKLDPVATGKCSARSLAVSGAHKFTSIDAGESHVCGLTADGQAWCWGDNASAQLGVRDSSETCAVDYYVQRGYAATPCAHAPRIAESELRFTAIAAASGFTCGLMRDGAVKCWGSWTNNRLGGAQGAIAAPGVARFEDPGERFTQISADGNKVCALTSAERLLCWGKGRESPVPVATGVRFTAVSVGWRHACGIARDSTAYCWGENDSGQLGTGQVNPKFNSGDSTVNLVAGDLRFRRIDAGFLSTCAISIDGTQYCWGDGDVVGAAVKDRCAHVDAYDACALKPTRTSLRDVVAMTSGFVHRCALVQDGTAFCWGDNSSRAVAQGSAKAFPAPERVLR